MPSEVFRQAKFDNPSVIEELWTILGHLYELIQQICLLRGRGRSNNEFLFTSGKLEGLQRKWMKWQVKRFVFKQGYARFSRLLEGEESSRELLILFGWLLQKYQVILWLKQACLYKAMPSLECLGKSESAIADLQQEMSKIQEALESNRIDKCLLQQLVVLRGGMNTRYKRLKLTASNYQKLVKQIHQHTHNPKGEILTLHDLYLLQHPHLIVQHEKYLQKRIAVLETFMEWNQLEDVFWMWMNSVLELADKGREPTVGNDATPTNSCAKAVASQVQNLIREADSLIRQNSYHLSYLNDLIMRAKVKLLSHDEELYLEDALHNIFEGIMANELKGHKELIHQLTWDDPCQMPLNHTSTSISSRSGECKVLQEKMASIKQSVAKQVALHGELVPDSMAITFD